MKVSKLSDYTRGWIIGDFEPSILRTKTLKLPYSLIQKGKSGCRIKNYIIIKKVEYNILVSGKMMMQDQELNAGDVFVLDRYEVADPVFLEDCKVVCVKTPSIPSDKFEVTK